MGVDFYACDYCGDTFPDCGEYVSCECGEHWCSDECAEADGFKEESCSKGFDNANECDLDLSCWQCEFQIERSCKYCREEDFADSVLLEFSLKELGISREELINKYKNSR
jgi:hypothetical protein